MNNFQLFFTDCVETIKSIGDFQSFSNLKKLYAVMLVLFIAAPLPFPYEFYISLRLLICLGLAAFIYSINQSGVDSLKPYKYVLVGLIVLYNPLFVVHLGSKFIWAFVNAGTLYFLFNLRGKLGDKSESLSEKQDDPETTDTRT